MQVQPRPHPPRALADLHPRLLQGERVALQVRGAKHQCHPGRGKGLPGPWGEGGGPAKAGRRDGQEDLQNARATVIYIIYIIFSSTCEFEQYE